MGDSGSWDERREWSGMEGECYDGGWGFEEVVWVRRWRGVNGGWGWGDEKEGGMGSG